MLRVHSVAKRFSVLHSDINKRKELRRAVTLDAGLEFLKFHVMSIRENDL